MSTPQTNAHMEGQLRIYQEFDDVLMGFWEGRIDYDEVEAELMRLQDDDDCDMATYKKCEDSWEEVKTTETEWAREDYLNNLYRDK